MLPNELWLLSGTKADRADFNPTLVPALRTAAHLGLQPNLSLVEIMARFTEHSPQGILLLDENWRITYANGTAQAEAHIQPEDLNHRIFWDMYPQVLGTVLEQTYRQVAATRKRASIKEYHYAPFGTWADVDVLPMGAASVSTFAMCLTGSGCRWVATGPTSSWTACSTPPRMRSCPSGGTGASST